MNKTVKIALLASAAGSVALGGYVALQRHKNAESPEVPTEVVEEQTMTVIEKKSEPEEDCVPMAEIEKITDEDDQARE